MGRFSKKNGGFATLTGLLFLFLLASSDCVTQANHIGASVTHLKVSEARAMLDGSARLPLRTGPVAAVRRAFDARRDHFAAHVPRLEVDEEDFDMKVFGKGYITGLLTQVLPFLNDVESWESAKANMTRCMLGPLRDTAETFREAFDTVSTVRLPGRTDLEAAGADFREKFTDLRQAIKDFDIPSLARTAASIISDNRAIKDFIDDLIAGFGKIIPMVVGIGLELHQCGYSNFALGIFIAVLLMSNPIGWIILAIKVILAIAVVVDIVLQVRRAYDAYKEKIWFVFGSALGVITGNLFDLIALAKADMFQRKDQARDYKYRTEKGKLVTELENPPAELTGNAKQYGKTVKRQYTADVVKVYDGDTITVRRNGVEQKIRFAGIDAPEMSQPGGQEARDALQKIIDGNGGKVKVMSYGTDLYGRETADIFAGKTWAQSELLAKGRAMHYRAYDSRKHLDDLMRAAQKSKSGIWASDNIVAPWDYRKGKKIKATLPTEPEKLTELFPSWIKDLLQTGKLFRTFVPALAEVIDWAKEIFSGTKIDVLDTDIPIVNRCKLDPVCSDIIRFAAGETATVGFAAQNGTKTFKFTRTAGDEFKVELRTQFGAAQAIVSDGTTAWTIEAEGETDIARVAVPEGMIPDAEDSAVRRVLRRSAGADARSLVIVNPSEDTEYTVEVVGLQDTSFDLITDTPTQEDRDLVASGDCDDCDANSSDGGGGLSGGASAAIAVVVIGVVGAVAGAAFVWNKKRVAAANPGAAGESNLASPRGNNV